MVDDPTLLAHMVRARAVSVRMVGLQRSAKIGFHSSSIGDEAVIAGAVVAARASDWIFPSVREWAAALMRGLPVADYVHHAFGSAHDPALGHSAPDHIPARKVNVVPPSGIIGAHLVQAVGAAWAAKTRKDAMAAVALFGKEAIDTGDFHNALNFAGVFKAPVVLVCRAPVAERAIAYGIASAKVNGGDARAVHDLVKEGIARNAPLLIEAVPPAFPDLASHADLYNLGPNDPTGGNRDAAFEAEIEAAIAAAEAAGPPPRSTMFDHVYARRVSE
jgi:TPP-dependent pyruvate/acetoin dehydrogenase alpha subunit